MVLLPILSKLTIGPFYTSCCLRDGEVQVIPGASHLSLCLKLASQPLQLQLSELTCLQNQDQLRGLIFELWTRLNAAQSQLAGM